MLLLHDDDDDDDDLLQQPYCASTRVNFKLQLIKYFLFFLLLHLSMHYRGFVNSLFYLLLLLIFSFLFATICVVVAFFGHN